MKSNEDSTTSDSPKSEPSESRQLLGTISEYSNSFDILCQERHLKGQAEYGVVTFLGNDVVRMMMEELADTSNYCRMQFIKLMMLQHALEEQLETPDINIGKDAFKGTGEVGWTKK